MDPSERFETLVAKFAGLPASIMAIVFGIQARSIADDMAQ